MHDGFLHEVGEARGEAVEVVFVGAAPFGFDEDLVAVFVREAHDFVFDAGAVARAGAFDDAAVEGAVAEVGADDVVGALVGVGDGAGELPQLEVGVSPGVEGAVGLGAAVQAAPGAAAEEGRGLVAGLQAAGGEVDGAAFDARRGAGFEAAEGEAESGEAGGDAAGRTAEAPAGEVVHADVQQAAHEGAAAEDDGAGFDALPPRGADAGDAAPIGGDVDGFALEELEAGGGFEHPFHAGAVGEFVALGAGGADAGAFRGVEGAELDGGGVCIEAHGAAEGVDFADHVAFGEAADGGVAAHLPDGVEVLGDEGDAAAEAGDGEGGFDAGVPAADDDDVKAALVGEGHVRRSAWR